MATGSLNSALRHASVFAAAFSSAFNSPVARITDR